MGNYRYFFLYILFHCLAMFGYNITMYKFLYRNGWDWLIGTLGLYVGLFILPGLGMLSYHLQLISKVRTACAGLMRDDCGRAQCPSNF